MSNGVNRDSQRFFEKEYFASHRTPFDLHWLRFSLYGNFFINHCSKKNKAGL
jgi:hypothetical protein